MKALFFLSLSLSLAEDTTAIPRVIYIQFTTRCSLNMHNLTIAAGNVYSRAICIIIRNTRLNETSNLILLSCVLLCLLWDSWQTVFKFIYTCNTNFFPGVKFRGECFNSFSAVKSKTTLCDSSAQQRPSRICVTWTRTFTGIVCEICNYSV